MAYCDPRHWPTADGPAFESYLDRLAEAAYWLTQTGRRLIFLASAGADNKIADEFLARMLTRFDPAKCNVLLRAPVLTVDEFLEQARAVDIVVASRLHSLLLAHLAGTPAIALSYDRKVNALMEATHQSAYALDINDFTLAGFQRVFTDLENDWHAARDRLITVGAANRILLQRQFDRVLRPRSTATPNQIHGITRLCHLSLLSA
jgi:polysaccharide pyruvyl transferase WcaK-like protein